MKAFRTMRSALVAIVVAAATLPAGLLAAPTLRKIYDLAAGGAYRELELEARNAAQAVRMELARLIDQAQAVSADSDVRRGVKSVFFLERADVRLDTFARDNPLAATVWLLGADGRAVTAIPETVLAHAPPAAVTARVRRFFEPGAPVSERGYAIMPLGDGEGAAIAVLQPVVGLLGKSGGMLAVFVSLSDVAASVRRALPAGLSFTFAAAGGSAGATTDDEVITASTDVVVAAPAGGELRATLTVTEPAARRFAGVRKSVLELAGVAVAAVIMLGALGFLLARWLTGPVAVLSAQARAYAAGRYEVPVPDARFAEFNEVARTLSTMGREIQAHLAGERARLEAELAALRNQMSPHFLFNTLNAISTTVSLDPERASLLLAKVADLYRMILESTKGVTAPLARELEIARLYLELEALRFGAKRLRYAFELEAPVEGLFLPGLIVQTLVENAVKHGIAKARGGGLVRVRLTRRADGFHELAVANGGAAFQGETPAGAGSGVGLKNTRQRLDLLYGDQHGFQIGTNERGETEVRFGFDGARHGSPWS